MPSLTVELQKLRRETIALRKGKADLQTQLALVNERHIQRENQHQLEIQLARINERNIQYAQLNGQQNGQRNNHNNFFIFDFIMVISIIFYFIVVISLPFIAMACFKEIQISEELLPLIGTIKHTDDGVRG
ncbi:hypothetical protein DSL72_007350 [Monilinia vaccinii-corymbosi]|uniref:Uncharacterized protein n=1 Tax=Monilinia vaccinii-corymbosi TaxID=61207 RepID=A0A8A3PMS5_9HELO|nr:hypothetical protein DSL72_007350 [Monilinia vaccinii-corymbosi]